MNSFYFGVGDNVAGLMVFIMNVGILGFILFCLFVVSTFFNLSICFILDTQLLDKIGLSEGLNLC